MQSPLIHGKRSGKDAEQRSISSMDSAGFAAHLTGIRTYVKEGHLAREKMVLEKFTEEDFELYYALAGDEEVMAMITERALPREQARVNFRKLLANNTLHPAFGSFKALEPETRRFIGLAMLKVKESDSFEAELGYMLLPAFWGKGLGGEIARRMVDLARIQPQLKRLHAVIDPKNIPSRRILIRQGFVSEGLCEVDGLPGEILGLAL